MVPSRTGFWISVITSAGAAASLTVGVSTPVRSGPNCRSDCLSYPYADAAAFVPRDYLWLYPAILTSLIVVVLVAYLHDGVPRQRRWLSRAGLCFAAMGSAVLVVDYTLQLAVVQPALLAGETDGLSILSQYDPHGVFIGLENLGYATLGVALALLGVVLTGGPRRLGRAVGWIFGAAGTTTLILLVLFAVVYRARLEYRFEVLAIGIVWLALILGGGLLAVMFARPVAEADAD